MPPLARAQLAARPRAARLPTRGAGAAAAGAVDGAGGLPARETVRLYHSLRRHDDRGRYRVFAWLERADGGERRYLAPLAADAGLRAGGGHLE